MPFERVKVALMPTAGTIKGGKMDGWHYAFQTFRVSLRMSDDNRYMLGSLQLLAKVTPPAWPFPRDVVLHPDYFMSLRHVKKSGAKKISPVPIVSGAFRAAGLETPMWAIETNRTPRWFVKRGALFRVKVRKPQWDTTSSGDLASSKP